MPPFEPGPMYGDRFRISYAPGNIPELDNALSYIKFDGFSEENKDTVLNLLANLFSRRDRIKEESTKTLKFRYLNQFLKSLPGSEEESFAFVYHNHPSRPPQVDRRNRYIWHNPDWINTRSFIDAYGRIHQSTEERVLIHEMVHLLLDKEDDYTYRGTHLKNFDPAGETVRWTNAILFCNDKAYKSIGKNLRISYMGWIKNKDIAENIDHFGYINSLRTYQNDSIPIKSVDNIIVSYGKGGRKIENQSDINASIFKLDNGNSPKNLIVGANENKKYRFEGADRKDYLYGNQKKDVLIGGANDDLLIGGNGDDILSAESRVPIQAIQDALRLSNPFQRRIDRVIELNTKDSDTFYGGPGNDLIIGNYRGEDMYEASPDSPAIDIAVYSGKRCDYKLGGKSSDELNYISVKDLRDNRSDGTDHLWDIEAIKFNDQTYYTNNSKINKRCPTIRVPRLCGSVRNNYFKRHSDAQNVASFDSDYTFKATTKGRKANKLIIESTDHSYSAIIPAGSKGRFKGRIKFEFDNYTVIKPFNFLPLKPAPEPVCVREGFCLAEPPRASVRRRDTCMPGDLIEVDPRFL